MAFDIESVTGAPPCGNAYIAGLRARHPETFIGTWGAVDPCKGEQAIAEARTAVREHGVTRVPLPSDHGPFRGRTTAALPLFENIAALEGAR